MKRLICGLFTCLLLLSGCTAAQGPDFYYLRSEYRSGTEDGVIAAERREVSGHENDLSYLLRLYLEGPLDSAYTSPFPKGTHLLGIVRQEDTLLLELSEELAQLEAVELTLACSCLARTCFSLTDARQVQILSGTPKNGSVDMTLTRDSLMLTDSAAETTPPKE